MTQENFDILRTSRSEISEHLAGAGEHFFAGYVNGCPDAVLKTIARRVAESLLQGAEYWEALLEIAVEELEQHSGVTVGGIERPRPTHA